MKRKPGTTLIIILLLVITAASAGAYTPFRVLTPGGIAFERWADSSFPIVWRLNPGRGNNIAGFRSLRDLVLAATQTWTGVSTAQVSFTEGAHAQQTNNGLDQLNLISFVPVGFNSDAVSLTYVYSCMEAGPDPCGQNGFQFAGQIVEADIVFNP